MDVKNSIQGTGEAQSHLTKRRHAQKLLPIGRHRSFPRREEQRLRQRTLQHAQVQASDPEGATLVYVLTEAPEAWRLHYASGLLNGRAPAQPGTYPVALEVTDGQGGIAHGVFSPPSVAETARSP